MTPQHHGQDGDSPASLKVLHVAPTFYPAVYWGGTTSCNLDLCNALSKRPEIALSVLTTDSAGLQLHERLAESGLEITFPDGYKVFYARRRFGMSISPELLKKLWPMVKAADVVHLTGVYSFPSIPTLLVCRALNKPLVLAPHGALQRWEGSTRPVLKRIWEMICDLILPRRTVLLVTSKEEAEESRVRIKRATMEIIPHGVEIPETVSVPKRSGQGLRLMYIGRLHQKKGIENLLHAMTELGPDVVLDVYGTGDAQYTDSLRQLTEKLQLLQRVRFLGQVSGTAKSSAFFSADICVVPSYTENFAMVVVEALAHAVPVIASTGTPWRELNERHCGAWVSNDPLTLAAAIRNMQTQDLVLMGKRGREWMQQQFSWASVGARTATLYRNIAASASAG